MRAVTSPETLFRSWSRRTGGSAVVATLALPVVLSPRYALAVVWLGYVHYLSGDTDGAASLLKLAIIDLGPPDFAVAEVARRYVDKM